LIWSASSCVRPRLPKKTKGPDVRKPRNNGGKPPVQERQQWSRNTLDKIDYMASKILDKIKYAGGEDYDFFTPKVESAKSHSDYITKKDDALPHLIHADYLEDHGLTSAAKHIRDVVGNVAEENPDFENNHRIFRSQGSPPLNNTHFGLTTHLYSGSPENPHPYEVDVTHWFNLPKQKSQYMTYVKGFGSKKHAQDYMQQIKDEGVPDEFD